MMMRYLTVQKTRRKGKGGEKPSRRTDSVKREEYDGEVAREVPLEAIANSVSMGNLNEEEVKKSRRKGSGSKARREGGAKEG